MFPKSVDSYSETCALRVGTDARLAPIPPELAWTKAFDLLVHHQKTHAVESEAILFNVLLFGGTCGSVSGECLGS